MKTQITKNKYFQVIGLLELAKTYESKLHDVEKALAEILGVKGEGDGDAGSFGHVSDACYSGYSPDQLLNKLSIKVLKDSKKK